ncbi:serine protease [Flavobacterium sp. CSZ]|uniref:trypsin-like serine peptidase n=1 Tax=Flavobacterium sp. CSZ TaxID=2783791 RepID=UPI00188B4A37|nr:serine protease [Flavobacterium sp. CSZ]MBF4487548.1 trypsin-like peptidase domain-containing protein [Flavobacterium sp. CSZ]
MAWTKKLTQLNDVLSDLIPNKDNIPKYVKASGLKQQFIDTSGNAMDVWSNVLSEADKNSKVSELVKSVLDTYPGNQFLKSALISKEIDFSESPDIDESSDWKDVSNETLEVLTMDRSTLLPVNFLAKGVQKSKSVGKVEIKIGNNRYNVGTGFLFKVKDIEDVFFITNYHVINNQKDIEKTRVIFDYELDINGNTIPSRSFMIDGNGPWYCSAVKDCDATIFKLSDDNNTLAEYGFIELKEIEILINDFVNIIQHPKGEMKQISLYHNIVTHTNERIVQYLTDTLKGSSGSPVFNSEWEVVALHHSGGGSKSDEPGLKEGIKIRNEGIFINKIIQFLKDNHKN